MDTFEVISNKENVELSEIKDQISKNRELTDAKVNIINDKLNSIDKEFKDQLAEFFVANEEKLINYQREICTYIDQIKAQVNVGTPVKQELNSDVINQITKLGLQLVNNENLLKTLKFRVEGIEYNFGDFRRDLEFKIKKIEKTGDELTGIILTIDALEDKLIHKVAKETKDVIYFETKKDLLNHSGNLQIIGIVKKGLFSKGAYYYDGYTWKKI